MALKSRCFSILYLSVALLNVEFARAQEKKEQPPVNEPKRGIDDPKASMPSAAAAVDPRTYKIGAEDIIFVRVWREAELTGPVMVRPDGKISLPLVGEIQAEGMTPEELGKTITTALLEKMNRPEVFISVQQVNSKKYFIIGEVNKTGPFPLVTPTTVMEALSAAGGLREFANKKKIIIMRGNQRLKFNFQEVLEGKKLDQNILLQNGDHIHVQ
jgi:polysaccharide export outer membrane protein